MRNQLGESPGILFFIVWDDRISYSADRLGSNLDAGRRNRDSSIGYRNNSASIQASDKDHYQ